MRHSFDAALYADAHLQRSQILTSVMARLHQGTDHGQPIPHLSDGDGPNVSIRNSVRQLLKRNELGL